MSRRIGAVVAGVVLLVVTACGAKSARLESGSASNSAVHAAASVSPVASPPVSPAVASEATDRKSPAPAPSEASPHDAPRGWTCGLRSTLRSLGQKDGVERYSLTLTNTSEQALSPPSSQAPGPAT